jgi:ABC-type polysaccharide/polyol phosphate export permease
MNYFRAIAAAFLQQWRTLSIGISSIGYFIGAIPSALVIGWIALKSNNQEVMTYLLIGAPLINVWNNVVLNVGWSLDEEIYGRVLDFSIISRTPLMVVQFGKALAHLISQVPTGLVALVTMIITIRHVPSIADIPSLLLSMIFIIIGMVTFSLCMSPVAVLAGGRGGFFTIFMSLGIMISGFMFPISRLPDWLQVIARIMPTSWAMSGVWKAITGYPSFWSMIEVWGWFLVTTGAMLFVTWLLFRAVEKRIKVTGELNAYW